MSWGFLSMTQDEIDKINHSIETDPYLIKRRQSPEWELRLFLREVNFHCPICGAPLQNSKQSKRALKLFEIAHIYPNRPTVEQYSTLEGLERLGENCEDFENKIALCLNCHRKQDFRTTQDDYLRLLEKKKKLLTESALDDATNTLGLEDEISEVVKNLAQISSEDLNNISFSIVRIENKFSKNEVLLKNKISDYIRYYYPFIREEFRRLECNDSFSFDALSSQMKSCFSKMDRLTSDKSLIFKNITHWIQQKTASDNSEACEIIVAFFVQNCEVFREVTE